MQFPKITISLNSFHYWFGDPLLEKILSHLIPRYADKVDGFEIGLSFSEMDEWIDCLESRLFTLPRRYENLSLTAQNSVMQSANNSFHLDDLKCLPVGREEWLAQCINKLAALTNINVFTIHPDEVDVDRWSIILNRLEAGAHLSIENMCFRKTNYKQLTEISDLLEANQNLSVTFDINHWIEQGYTLNDSSVDTFVSRFGHRINKIHLSACSTDAREYRLSPITSHYFCVDSRLTGADLNLAQFYYSHTPVIVLEGLIPIHDVQMLDREIDYVALLLNTQLGITGLPTQQNPQTLLSRF